MEGMPSAPVLPSSISDDLAPAATLSGLTAALRRAGVFETRYGYYLALGGVLVAVTAGIGAGLVAIGASAAPWAAIALALPAALVSAQFGFLGHDAGHHQVVRSRRGNRWIGLVAGNVGSGLSFGWWQDKHRRHHQHVNRPGLDPDIDDGVIAWTAEQHAAARSAGGRRAFVARRQALLFVPLLTFEGWHLVWSSARALRRRSGAGRRLEAGLLVLHAAAYLGFLFAALPVPVAVTFVLVHRALYGLVLGAAFAPNHVGMALPEHELDPLRRQVLTSRDIAGSRLLDLAMGGLNHQIEHHLSPRIPRPNLRRAAPIVRRFCVANGVPYHAVDLSTAYQEVFAALAADRPRRRGSP